MDPIENITDLWASNPVKAVHVSEVWRDLAKAIDELAGRRECGCFEGDVCNDCSWAVS